MTHSGFWLGQAPLVLASGSATRRMLLESAGLLLEVRPAHVDERAIEAPFVAAGLKPVAVALDLARAKALAVAAGLPGRIVLGADQTLSLGGRPMHKPGSVDEARRQIAILAGQTHVLHSALALACDGAILFEAVESAAMTMRVLSPAFIELYVEAAGAGVCDSVGGYKLEGLGIHLFERIEGDQSTILGLPLLPLLRGLRELRLVAG